jgi:magnesium-protoporphyrin O-methyltransferase
MAMWWTGKLLPRSDRSPVMVPHAAARLGARLPGLATVGRITSGFYISECLEVRR